MKSGGAVSRIDARTLRVIATISVGSHPDRRRRRKRRRLGRRGSNVSARIALALAAVALAMVAASCGGRGASTIRIGVLADCEGPFSFGQGSSYAGAELPLIRRGARPLGSQPANGISEVAVAGRRSSSVFGCGDFTAEKTLTEARRLVEQDGVDDLDRTDRGRRVVRPA